MTLLDRARQIVTGARAYRFEGERENHADQLRQTEVSLSMMATADAEDPDQTRMATEIEHDAEARLTVLLGKPRLTLEEKRERDAIQAAISARRQGFAGNVLVPREDAPTSPRRFLGPLAVVQPWMILGAAAAGLFVIWQADAMRLRFDRDKACGRREVEVGATTTRRPCVELGETQRQLEHSHAALREATQMVRAADANAMQTAETLRSLERQRALRAAQQRRTQRELETLRSGLGEPPELGLHDVQPTASGANPNGGT